MTIQEIREALVGYGIDDLTLKTLGKKELGEMLEGLQDAREDLANGNLAPENLISEDTPEPTKRPRYQDPEWHDFVMSQFVPEELDDKGNPKVDGLRRVTEGLLGEIVESRPIQSTSQDGMAAVNWILMIAWLGDNPSIDLSGDYKVPTRTFGAFADANPTNCKAPYSNFLASMADTRAEAKAFRRALRLRCIAAEEAQLGDNTFEEKVSDGSFKDDEPVNDSQKALITTVADRLNIDIGKLVDSIHKHRTLESLTKAEAAVVIRQLTIYQTKIKDKSESVPVELLKV